MTLKIYLLGQFNLHANHRSLELPSRPAQSLLAYLALNAGITIRRERLASLLWPEAAESNARKYLRHTLWRIRKCLEDGSLAWDDYLQASDIEVTFKQHADYWLDADLLLTREKHQQVEGLIETVQYYQGELLPGFFDQWVVLERERLQAAYHHKMSQLLECLLQDSQWGEVLNWAEKWILLGYSPEPAFRALMIAYAGLGDQGMVSATYQRCMAALNRDLGLAPSLDTRKLFEQIVSGEPLPTLLGIPEPDIITIPEKNPAPGAAPYKGLDIFDTQDAHLFFGREKLTARLAGRLQEGEQLLFVVGASGSGKSSLVRAGLVPTLTKENPVMNGSFPPSSSTTWSVHVIQPTSQPLEALADALCQDHASLRSVATLIDDLRHDSRALHLCARRLCQKKDKTHLLLVVDQFEELFTLCQDEAQRSAFIANLLTSVDPQVSGPTHVVVTLRADFYPHCAQYPELRQQLALHQEYIGTMDSEELRMAVEEPAHRNNWDFEPGLVDLILRDVRGQPGSLPLLSHALLETWRRRRGCIMTLKSYAEAGSVHGAIAHTAETVYQQELDETQQVIAHHIFLRLTDLGEDTPGTRRRVQLTELLPSADQRTQVEAVLDKLVAARLVTVSQEYVEVSHEALIREWPTLRSWLEADREGVRLHHQLAEAAQAWEAMEQDESALYQGAKLAAALEWAQEHIEQVNHLEHNFLESSKIISQRRQQEQIRANRRLRRLVVGLAGVLLVAILSSAYAFNLRNQAEIEAHLANSRQYTAAALNNLEVDPQLSILLALEAVAEARNNGLPVPKEAQEALHYSLQTNRLELVIDAHRGGVTSIDFSPDGKRIASVGKDFTLKVWDAHSGQLLNATRATNIESTHVIYSPDGRYLATSDQDLTAKIWDSQTLVELTSLEGHESGVMTLAFSLDGTQLVTSSGLPWGIPEGSINFWNLEDYQLIRKLGGSMAEGFNSISFRPPDGNMFTAANSHGPLRFWDTATFEVLHTSNVGAIFSLDFSPDGTLLATSEYSQLLEPCYVTLWDLRDLDKSDSPTNAVNEIQELRSFPAHTDQIRDLEFSPDGNFLATGSLDGTAKIWDVQTRKELLQLSGHGDRILSLAYDPSSDRLATASMDGTIRIWNISTSREYLSFSTGGGGGRIAFSPDSSLLAAGADREEEIRGEKVQISEVHLWDLETGDEPVKFTEGDHPGGVKAVAFSPNGSRLASVGADDSLKIWDVKTGRLLASNDNLGFESLLDVVYSPDGSQIAVGGYSYSILLLDATTAEQVDEFIASELVSGLTFSPDGSQLVATTGSGFAVIWDISTRNERPVIGEPGSKVEDVAFNPPGDRLALSSADGTVAIWSIAENELQLVLQDQSAPVMGVDFSPDGSRVATVDQYGNSHVWDAKTGEELLLIEKEGGIGMQDIKFSPDGKMLATSSEDAVRVYLLDMNDLVNLANRRLSRGFSSLECLRFLPESRCEQLLESTPVSVPILPIEASKKICLITDPLGVSKYSIHYLPYLGVMEAAERHDWEWQVFVPQEFEGLSEIFERALGSNCDLIIAMSWFVEGALREYHFQYPDQKFLLLDYTYDPSYENVRTSWFASDQGGFLAGYLAAAMSRSGMIGTFGSDKMPTVTDFMTGYESGMQYFNQKYRASVQLIGWDSEKNEGLFTGNFEDDVGGYQLTRVLLAQGADIIFPVGERIADVGSLRAVQENQQAYVIGMSTDYYQFFPEEFAPIILTSVLKRSDQSVLRAADAISAGTFKGGPYLGTLETGEVDLAPFYDKEDLISEQIKADLEQIKDDIISGKIQTKPGE